MPDGLRALAEDMFFVTPPPLGANREVSERFVLHAPASGNRAFTGIGRIRLGADEVDATVEELRARFAALGHSSMAWWVGPSSRPTDLGERLRGHGFRPLAHGPVDAVQTAMATTATPAAGGEGFDVQRVRSLDEFRDALDVHHDVTGRAGPMPEDALRRDYESRHMTGEIVWYVARIDGVAAAAASAHFTPAGVALNGGFTRERYRGRGAYRALVCARWEDAVAAGTPGLAVLAGQMSRPILDRLGFQSLGTVEVLVDDFGSRAS